MGFGTSCTLHILYSIPQPASVISQLNPRAYFILPIVEDYPNGWPKVAAFLEGCDSFGIYRRFGYIHSRLLVAHQTKITHFEQQLRDLDQSDEAGGESTDWRLKGSLQKERWDTAKIDLLKELEKEILAYGTLFLYLIDISSFELDKSSFLLYCLCFMYVKARTTGLKFYTK